MTPMPASSRRITYAIAHVLFVLALIVTMVLSPAQTSGQATPIIIVDTLKSAIDYADNYCSLREAIIVANTRRAAVTARGECPVVAGEATIDLSRLSGTILLDSSLPPITGTMRLIGPGADVLTVSGQGQYRPFFINGSTLTIKGLTIADGLAVGGNGGDGYDGAGAGGGGAGMGGGMFINSGHVTLDQVAFRNNHVRGGQGGNGGTFLDDGGGGGGGGGVAGNGTNGGDIAGGNGGIGEPFNTNGETPGGAVISQPGGDGLEGSGGGGGASGQGTTQQSGKGGGGGFGAGGGGVASRFGGAAGGGGFGGGGGGGSLDMTSVGKGAGGSNFGGPFGGEGGLINMSLLKAGGGGGGGAGLGGGLFVRFGTVSLVGVHFQGNSAHFGSGNGLPRGDDGEGKGGGLFVNDAASVTLFQTTFDGNSAITRPPEEDAPAPGIPDPSGDWYGPVKIVPLVKVFPEGSPSRTGPVPGIFTIRREQAGDGNSLPELQVLFRLGGTALYGVNYDLEINGQAQDQNTPPNQATIPAGASSATLKITPRDDQTAPPNQTIDLFLDRSADYILDTSDHAQLRIDGDPAPAWLVLLYVAADDAPPPDKNTVLTSLSKPAADLLVRLRKMPRNANMRLVVLVDSNQGGRNSDEQGDTRVYIRQPGEAELRDVTATLPGSAFWQTFPENGEVDTGRVSTLQNFILWARRSFAPSPHTMLSIIDHGGGWAPGFGGVSQPRSARVVQSGGGRGMAVDHRSGSSLSTRDTGDVFRGLGELGKFDLVFFDACLMGMIENAYEIEPFAKYFIAGENLLWADLPYEKYFSTDTLKADTSPPELARQIVGNYNTPTNPEEPFTIAALDMERVRALAGLVDKLALELLNALDTNPNTETRLRRLFPAVQKFDYDVSMSIDAATDGYVDLGDLMIEIQKEFPRAENPQLYDATQAVIDGLDRSLVLPPVRSKGEVDTPNGKRVWDFSEAHGLAIYMPIGEQDCRFTGLMPANGAPVPERVCKKVAPGQARIDPGEGDDDSLFLERQLFYYTAEQMRFLRDAPNWPKLLNQLEEGTPARALEKGPFRAAYPLQTPSYTLLLPIITMPSLIDLEVVSVRIHPPVPRVGEPVQVSVTIRNTGIHSTTQDFWVDLYVDPYASPRLNQRWQDIGSYGVAWRQWDALGPNKTATLISTNANDPLNPDKPYSNFRMFASPGVHKLYVQADSWGFPWGNFEEINEANNVLGPIEVTVSAEPYSGTVPSAPTQIAPRPRSS